ncbi:GGDEF domain-containing protein [Noviherbaspirillum massiliense]|uniref:GGDEF domain-containing protein n=1 Tax=Noviherbaspirillum massiliense TaxID=1465823 RepID=UPI000372E4A0|nr:GGDEF domain-containing protein [Noviherbaspirillum massiliense]
MTTTIHGPGGREQLIELLLRQFVVDGDEGVANRIADKCRTQGYAPGAELIRQGDSGSDIFLILTGSVSIVVHGREVGQRSAGQHVGEMALVNPNARRTASVIAKEEALVAILSEPDFSAIAEKAPKLWRRLAGEMGSRIGQYNQHEAHLEYAAFHDPLTSLPNRNLFADRFKEATAATPRGDGCALLYLDLDRFKPVNDTYGHATGDQLLKLVAQRIRGNVKPTDTVARYGGDEFVILLAGAGGRENASTVAARLVQDLSRPFTVNSIKLSISASVGIAFYPDHGQDLDILMQRADLALYEAKKAGRDTYQLSE